jgi:uncharacterized protein (UPF0548 family)
MFLARRPSESVVARFLRESQDLPLSYGPIGILDGAVHRRGLLDQRMPIGRGRADFERARAALTSWRHFDTGWTAVFPRDAPFEVGTVVAVLIRHAGFWSLNGCRVVYHVNGAADEARFGFAYGTLTNHAEAGEELFEVLLDPQTDEVLYRIRAISSPGAMLTRLGGPIVRLLQARFRRDSALAMRRAAGGREDRR